MRKSEDAFSLSDIAASTPETESSVEILVSLVSSVPFSPEGAELKDSRLLKIEIPGIFAAWTANSRCSKVAFLGFINWNVVICCSKDLWISLGASGTSALGIGLYFVSTASTTLTTEFVTYKEKKTDS